MTTNKKVQGNAIFCDEDLIKKKSIKLYTYLTCKAYLRNAPNAYGDNVRIFQQKDISLLAIRKIFHMDERTIKKLWEGLEDAGLIRFTPRDWKEKRFIDGDGEEKIKVPFNERWKERRKHPETYYEIPITKETLFRKVPKETLTLLNERYNVNELTMKLYITMINYQEQCYYENISIKRFTYKDLRILLGFANETVNNRKFEDCLRNLESLGLIELDTGDFKNGFGATIPCFILKQANFYINYKIKDFETGEECAINDAVIEKIKKINTELYPESFK